MRIVRNITLKAILLLAFILLAYGSVSAKNTFSIITNTIEKEKIIFVSKETNDTIADKICRENGLGETCWRDLKAMRVKESIGGQIMIGDGGKSKGWYHIQTKLHGVSEECALNFQCSTEWTIKNLIRNGYLKNRKYAIMKHNGSGIAAQNYAKEIIALSVKFNY